MMSWEMKLTTLTDEQQGRICGILSIGCDRWTAANAVGCLVSDIRRAMQRDSQFADSIRRAEAAAELSHMRNVQEAAKGEKNWRASVWWLERQSPERFGTRGTSIVTPRQLKAFVAILVDCVLEEVHSAEDRVRVTARMRSIADAADQLIREQATASSDLAARPRLLPHDEAHGQSESSIPESFEDENRS
jgi:hypothetical protein